MSTNPRPAVTSLWETTPRGFGLMKVEGLSTPIAETLALPEEAPMAPSIGEAVVAAVFHCAVCEQVAATVYYVPPNCADPQDPTGERSAGVSDPRLSVRGGPWPVTIHLLTDDPSSIERLVRERKVGRLYEMNPEYVPFWCQKCRKAYCREDWRSVDVHYDQGFFDYVEGTCARGHRRELMD